MAENWSANQGAEQAVVARDPENHPAAAAAEALKQIWLEFEKTSLSGLYLRDSPIQGPRRGGG